MIEVTLFNTETGEFGPQIAAQSMAEVQCHLSDTIKAMPGAHNRLTHRVNPVTGRVVKRKPELAELKADALAELDRRWRAAERGGAKTSYGPVETDRESLIRLNLLATRLAVLSAEAESGFAIEWIMADNTAARLDAAAAREMLADVFDHIAACHARKQELKAAICAARSTDRLDTIDIATGWPGGED